MLVTSFGVMTNTVNVVCMITGACVRVEQCARGARLNYVERISSVGLTAGTGCLYIHLSVTSKAEAAVTLSTSIRIRLICNRDIRTYNKHMRCINTRSCYVMLGHQQSHFLILSYIFSCYCY